MFLLLCSLARSYSRLLSLNSWAHMQTLARSSWSSGSQVLFLDFLVCPLLQLWSWYLWDQDNFGNKGVLVQYFEILWRLVILAYCKPVKLKPDNLKAKDFWICCYRSAVAYCCHISYPCNICSDMLSAMS